MHNKPVTTAAIAQRQRGRNYLCFSVYLVLINLCFSVFVPAESRRGSSLCPAGSPQTQGSMECRLCSSRDCAAPLAQRAEPGTFPALTALLGLICHFIFLTGVCIYMNCNQLSRNKEVSSENPLTFISNSRIQSPNQLWVRGFVFCEVTSADISRKPGRYL